MSDENPIESFDEPKLEALVEVMVLAASADGDFAPEERERLERNIETLTSRRVAGDKLHGLLASLEARIESEGRATRLAAVKAALGQKQARIVALDLALQVMASDGIIRTSERELILETAEALEIDPEQAAEMVKRVTR